MISEYMTNSMKYPAAREGYKEAGGQATCIAPLRPTAFATFLSWRIRRELAVQDLPVLRLQR